MDTLQIKKENAITAYQAADSDVKKVMENLFGVDTFKPQGITNRIKSFDDACAATNVDPTTISFQFPNSLGAHLTSVHAYLQLIIITRALNEGWVPNWTNEDEIKYYPWFDLSSGSGLSYLGCVVRYSGSLVGSRLCFKSQELAEYAAKQFESIYTNFFIIK